jgi:hypothetical protein
MAIALSKVGQDKASEIIQSSSNVTVNVMWHAWASVHIGALITVQLCTANGNL